MFENTTVKSLLSIFLFVKFLCFSVETQLQEGNITHTTTTLSQARYQLAATSSGELVFFAGGYNSTGPSDRVDIYNVTSGYWTTATLSIPRFHLAATSSQNLVFFGGGWNGTSYYDRVDIYNTFNGSWSIAALSQPRAYLAATSVGNFVLFGGGYSSNVVDVFDVTNNTWTNAILSQVRYGLAATSVDNRYALFGGGNNVSSPSNVVDIFDSLSGMWNTTTLSQARYELVSTSLGNLAFFGGGQTSGSQPSNVVDIFNSISQTWSNTTLSQARYYLTASSIGEIVAFGGGTPDGSTYFSSVVDMLNVTNNIWFTVNLSQPRCCLASTSSTNKIFFGGGRNSSNQYSKVVDVFFFGQNRLTVVPSSQSNMTQPNTPLIQDGLSTEAVVGIVIAIILFFVSIGIVVFLILLIKRRKFKMKQKRKKRNRRMRSSLYRTQERLKTQETQVSEKRDYNTSEKGTTSSVTNTQVTTENKSQKEINRLSVNLVSTQSATQYSAIPFKELLLEKEIGEGSFGKVFLGKWNNISVALKFCRRKGKVEEFMKEANLMIRLPPHPNVVQLFGVSMDDESQPVMVMEYCGGGSLDKVLFDPNEKLSEEHMIRLVRGITAGLLHLHKHNIVHRDLAARNILLTSGGEPKISDFGMSRILERTNEGKTQSGVGPVCWMAPESIAHRTYSKASDIWSFGIVVYEIVAQREPHKDKDVFEVGLAIRDHGLTPEIPGDCPPLLRELMKKCWQKNPEQRPTTQELCEILGVD